MGQAGGGQSPCQAGYRTEIRVWIDFEDVRLAGADAKIDPSVVAAAKETKRSTAKSANFSLSRGETLAG